MTPSNTARARQTRKRTRIQVEKEETILDGALEIFSRYGYRGATVDQIAEASGMSKPNLLYYFRRKHDIYVAVLRRTLEMWLQPLEEIDESGDPAEELTRYIAKKLEFEIVKKQRSNRRLARIEVFGFEFGQQEAAFLLRSGLSHDLP
jgi:TetR/AcrR family transcriptional regulator